MAVTNYYSVGGMLIGEETSGVRTDYLTDALGSVTATVDQTGTVQNTYRYKPYGATLAKTGTAIDPKFAWVGSYGYRQTGKKYSDTYVRARHYASMQGNWTTKDPIKQIWTKWRRSVGTTTRPPSTLTGPYYSDQYVFSSPVTFIDPSGLIGCTQPSIPPCKEPGYTLIKDPDKEYGTFSCPTNDSDLRRIACYCNIDRTGGNEIDCPDDPGLVGGGPQAITQCYSCGTSECMGCTLFDKRYGKMPSIYQHCIAVHERRRRVSCYAKGDISGGDNDGQKILACVWEALRRCNKSHNPIVQGCKPLKL